MPMRRALLLVLVVCACGAGAAPLPTATADIGATHVSLARGSYCWSSGGQATCADSAPPDMLLQTGYLKPFEAAAGSMVKVTFSSQPSKVDVSVDGKSSGSGATFTLPGSPGRYVYTVAGVWPEGDVGFFVPVDVTG
jgi:hypothetical protein